MGKISKFDLTIGVLSAALGIDAIITPLITSYTLGSPTTLHEFVGLSPKMDEGWLIMEKGLWGVSMLYMLGKERYDSWKELNDFKKELDKGRYGN